MLSVPGFSKQTVHPIDLMIKGPEHIMTHQEGSYSSGGCDDSASESSLSSGVMSPWPHTPQRFSSRAKCPASSPDCDAQGVAMDIQWDFKVKRSLPINIGWHVRRQRRSARSLSSLSGESDQVSALDLLLSAHS